MKKLAISLALMLACCGLANAETIYNTPQSLATLLTPGSAIQSGDKIIFNFHNFTQITTFLNLDPSSIFVSPIVGGPDGDEYGVRFSLGAFLQGANKVYDLGLDFQVRRVDGAALIHDNTLKVNGSRVGDATISLTEIVTDSADDSFLADKLVFYTPTVDKPIDHQVFTHVAAVLDISKDLLLRTNNDPNAIVTVSHFDQTFSQLVPEPGSIALASMSGIAMLGMALSRRRRAVK